MLAWRAGLSALLGCSLVSIIAAPWWLLRGIEWQTVLRQTAFLLLVVAPLAAFLIGIVNFAWHRIRHGCNVRRGVRTAGSRPAGEVALLCWRQDGLLLMVDDHPRHFLPWPAVRGWVEDAASMVLILHPGGVVAIARAQAAPEALASLRATMAGAGVQPGVGALAAEGHVADVFT
jgi:hypothetical protein